MPDYTNVTAAHCSTATTLTLEELQATMRTMTQDKLARVCRFNVSARDNPCSICGAVMEMNVHEEIGVCEHVMAAVRRQFGQAVDMPTMRPMDSPLLGMRIYVKQGKE